MHVKQILGFVQTLKKKINNQSWKKQEPPGSPIPRQQRRGALPPAKRRPRGSEELPRELGLASGVKPCPFALVRAKIPEERRAAVPCAL